MNPQTELWSIRRIAQFLDNSVNYTRNVLVKQPDFPKPRYNMLLVDGRHQKSKPRWFNYEVIRWAQETYMTSESLAEQMPKKRGRKRKE